jgi:hypothetical protein
VVVSNAEQKEEESVGDRRNLKAKVDHEVSQKAENKVVVRESLQNDVAVAVAAKVKVVNKNFSIIYDELPKSEREISRSCFEITGI